MGQPPSWSFTSSICSIGTSSVSSVDADVASDAVVSVVALVGSGTYCAPWPLPWMKLVMSCGRLSRDVPRKHRLQLRKTRTLVSGDTRRVRYAMGVCATADQKEFSFSRLQCAVCIKVFLSGSNVLSQAVQIKWRQAQSSERTHHVSRTHHVCRELTKREAVLKATAVRSPLQHR